MRGGTLPVSFLTADDPPVLSISRPTPNLAGHPTGHPGFGHHRKRRMYPLGIGCVAKHSNDYAGRKVNVWPRAQSDAGVARFFRCHLTP